MPYPNYHAARVRAKGDFARIVVLKTLDNGILIKGGPLRTDPGGSSVTQTYWIPKSKFTVDQARAWLKKNNITAILFEPAKPETFAEQSKIETDWMAVARTGKYPQGDLTEKVFDELVSNFNPEIHEPPETIGHIDESHNDKPAMAWVAGLKRVGQILFAKSKQVTKELDRLVKEGLFKKRSIAIRHNSKGGKFLHHLAWLGSATPACAGLPNVYDDENFYNDYLPETQEMFEFEDQPKPPKQGDRNMPREYSEAEIQALTANAATEAVKLALTDKEKSYGEDLKTKTEAAAKTAAEAERKKVEGEFAEKQKESEAALKHNVEIDKYCDELLKKNIITPAQLKAGLKNLLYSMHKPVEIKYSDEEKKEVTTDNLTLIKNVLAAYKEVPAGGTGDPSGSDNTNKDGDYAEEKKRAEKLVKEDKELNYTQALKQAREEIKAEKKQ